MGAKGLMANLGATSPGIRTTLPLSHPSNNSTRNHSSRYKLPLHPDDVHMVQCVESILAMSYHILGVNFESEAYARGGGFSDASLLSHSQLTPVGMDAEWQPYNRGELPSPVAVLQLATRDKAFVLDMQVMCRSVRSFRAAPVAMEEDEVRGSRRKRKARMAARVVGAMQRFDLRVVF